MKKLLFFCFLVSFSLTAFAQSILVAVTDFTARSGYSAEELENITELFAGFLRETKKTRVVTRSQWGAILGEHSFQKSGLVAENEIRSLGKALGAQNIITGTMMKLGNNNILNISLLDVETGEMISTARRTFDTLDEFLTLLPNLATDVLKTLEKPSPLIGTWIAEHVSLFVGWLFEFKEDGSFIITNYKRGTNDHPIRDNEFITQNLISGIVRGTYQNSNSSLTLNYIMTGNMVRQRDGFIISRNDNYTEKGTVIVSYSLSSNGLQIDIDVGPNEFFNFFTEMHGGRIVTDGKQYVTRLRKR